MALALGSNEGERLRQLRFGVEALRHLLDAVQLSSVYETTPMHRTDQRDFLNACCTGRTRLDVRQLLAEMQHIEKLAGRRRGERFGPRPLDLDLLLYDDFVIERPELVVPHRRIKERAFVLIPLREIAPDWPVPSASGGGATVAELAAAVSSDGVRRTKLKLEDG